jgi:hypothetical protein
MMMSDEDETHDDLQLDVDDTFSRRFSFNASYSDHATVSFVIYHQIPIKSVTEVDFYILY